MTMQAKLLIANLSVNCTDAHLRAWIESCGFNVADLTVIRDSVSGTSPSFAQVDLENVASMDEAARALNGQSLLGRTVTVKLIRPIEIRKSAFAGGVR